MPLETLPKEPMTPSFPIRFPVETMNELKRAAKKLRLSTPDVIRKAAELGLPDLIDRLTSPKKST